jgi:hypothetical protein
MSLTKSQRVNAIMNIATHLQDEEWAVIDLTLQQFSQPTRNQWSGDKQGYVVEMLGQANDDDLVELTAHFGIDAPGSPDDPPPLQWTPMLALRSWRGVSDGTSSTPDIPGVVQAGGG